MTNEYNINLSNGSVLATLFPLEANGPDNRSVPRFIQEARPAFAIVVATPGTDTFSIVGDYTDVFRVGFQFEVVDSTGNNGTFTVQSVTFAAGNTQITTVENWVDPTPDGYILAHIFRLASDLSSRFIGGFVFDVQNSGLVGSPPTGEIDGTYTVQSVGATFDGTYTIIPVINGSIRDNVLSVGSPATLDNVGLPLGEIIYTVPTTVGSPSELHTSLKLPGKGYINYGELIVEDLVHLLENFAADVSPDTNVNLGGNPKGSPPSSNPFPTPLTGQLWYKTLAGEEGFKFWDGVQWSNYFDIDDGALVFRDPENGNADVYLTAAEANLPGSPWVGTPEPGFVIWTETNPPNNEPVFRVLSADGDELLRVEYNSSGSPSVVDNSFVRTVGVIDIQGEGDPSHFAGDVEIDGYVGINQVHPVTDTPTGTDIRLAVAGSIQTNDSGSPLIPSQFLGSSRDETRPTYAWTEALNSGMFLLPGSPVGSIGLSTVGLERLAVLDDGILQIDRLSHLGVENTTEDRTLPQLAGSPASPGPFKTTYALNIYTSDDEKAVVNKDYVDGVVFGLRSWREPVTIRDETIYANLAAAEAAVNTGTIDAAQNVTLGDKDRILFVNITGADEDVYVINGTPPVATLVKDINDRTFGDTLYIVDGDYCDTYYVYNNEPRWREVPDTRASFLYFKTAATGGQTYFDLDTLSGGTFKYRPTSDGSRLLVYKNGVKQVFGSTEAYVETSSTEVTFNVPMALNDVVEFYAVGVFTKDATIKQETVIANAGQATAEEITFPSLTYVPGSDGLILFANGQKLIEGLDYIEQPDGVTVRFGSYVPGGFVLTVGDRIEGYSSVPIVAGKELKDLDDVTAAVPVDGDVLVYNGTSGLWEPKTGDKPLYEEHVAILGQTVFNTTHPVGSNGGSPGVASMQVFKNGVYQMEGATKAYTVTGTNQITFNAGLAAGDDVVIYIFG